MKTEKVVNAVPSLEEFKKFIDNKYGKMNWDDKQGVINSNLFIGVYKIMNEFITSQNGVETTKEQPVRLEKCGCIYNKCTCTARIG